MPERAAQGLLGHESERGHCTNKTSRSHSKELNEHACLPERVTSPTET